MPPARRRWVAHLKLLIAKMKRDRFDASAESGRRLLDLLEMQLKELETAAAEDEVAVDAASVRDDHSTAGAVPSHRAWPRRSGSAGDDHARQIRRTSAVEPAKRTFRS